MEFGGELKFGEMEGHRFTKYWTDLSFFHRRSIQICSKVLTDDPTRDTRRYTISSQSCIADIRKQAKLLANAVYLYKMLLSKHLNNPSHLRLCCNIDDITFGVQNVHLSPTHIPTTHVNAGIYISHGSTVTRFKCGRIVNDDFTAFFVECACRQMNFENRSKFDEVTTRSVSFFRVTVHRRRSKSSESRVCVQLWSVPRRPLAASHRSHIIGVVI